MAGGSGAGSGRGGWTARCLKQKPGIWLPQATIRLMCRLESEARTQGRGRSGAVRAGCLEEEASVTEARELVGCMLWRWIRTEATENPAPHLDQIEGRSRLSLDMAMWGPGAETGPNQGPMVCGGKTCPHPKPPLYPRSPGPGCQPHCPLQPRFRSPGCSLELAGACAGRARLLWLLAAPAHSGRGPRQ